MKKIISVILTLVLMLSVAFSLTGCNDQGSSGKTEELDLTPLSFALVLGAHKFFPTVTFTSEKLNTSLYVACRSYGDVSVVTSEGAPKIYSTINIKEPVENVDKKKEDQIAESNVKSIKNVLLGAKAETEEVDALKAISLASNALASSSCSRKELFIYDSGLCTAGLLSQLTQDYISGDAEKIADQLDSVGALPALTGVSVIWQGIGCVAGEQQTLPDSAVKALKNMWTVIITRAGGTVEFEPMPVSGEEGEGLPAVTPVTFKADKIVISDTGYVKFDETSLKFKPDLAEFTDEETARNVLKPVAEQLISSPELVVYIAGTTASVGISEATPVTGIELSERRAFACKDILVEMGVDASQIKCKGLGSAENVLRADDLDENGNLIEENAAKNRAIYIFSVGSDTAESLGLK